MFKIVDIMKRGKEKWNYKDLLILIMKEYLLIFCFVGGGGLGWFIVFEKRGDDCGFMKFVDGVDGVGFGCCMVLYFFIEKYLDCIIKFL